MDGNPLARATIANSLRSLGGQAHFLRHSDFLGALGATAHCISTVPKQKVRQMKSAERYVLPHNNADAQSPRVGTRSIQPPLSPPFRAP